MGDYTLTIKQDPDPESPREWDNLGTMACWHGRYKLGDIQPAENAGEYIKALAKGEVIFSLYLYDHSGLTIRTSPFSCPWDSGQVGIIHVSREKILSAYRAKRITPALIKKVKTCLQGEVETYDQYLRGDVYGYEVTDLSGETVDSCWGYFGIEHCQDEGFPALISAAEDEADRQRIAPACD